MLYLWKDWKTTPVAVNAYSERTKSILSPGSRWEASSYKFASHKMLRTELGEYKADGNRIVFRRPSGEEIILTDNEFEDISAIALSADHWRLYIGDKKRGCIYAATIAENGAFDGIYLFAVLHIPTDFKAPGALDLCVDSEDRVYAATELGIQCIRSFGLVDVILLNPGTAAVDQIELGQDGVLYARASDTIYARELNAKTPAEKDRIFEPKQRDYYS